MKAQLNTITSHLDEAARLAAQLDPRPQMWDMWVTYFLESMEEQAESLHMSTDEMLESLSVIIAERQSSGRW